MAISSWFGTFLSGTTATVLFCCVLRCFRFVLFKGPTRKQINSSMPSSSSSSHSTPPSSSSSQTLKHDVFLSFRGTDTRNAFVDHLYSAFVRQGINTYKDDETLPRGETIGPSLLRAIENSRIAVIVFSENYADSCWCLQELAHIMKCKDERGLIVIPIFYHIDPSEVRKQNGKYGEALAKYKPENINVESWRKALADVGSISGHVANGSEIKFIKEIVDTISNTLCVAISSDNEDLVGIGGRLQDLKSKMEMESKGVLMVGVWGVGGGGKTTLASSLYDEISCNFDGSCFIKDIREESSKDGLVELQKKVLALVLRQKQMELDGDVGRLIKSRFRRKKVLMVLDDVDHVNQLQALAGSHDWFGEGSRIIITTRDEHLLNAHKVNVIYNISLLNDDEAYKLFCKHALGHGRHIEDFERLSKDVVSRAGGLPLALIVLSSFLCDKDKNEWASALAKLKDIPDKDIMEKLKISYDGLDNMQKELFLDIACFFRGEGKEEAMVILDACGFHPTIGIKVLIQKALISVSEEDKFDMHDMIQEMGHYIVRGENPKNPEKHSRIWQIEDLLNIIALDSMMKNDRIEALEIGWHQHPHPPSLPKVVANMKELRWITCFDYPTTSFPRNFQPMKLCYLRLQGDLLKQLWKGNKCLPKLKVLDLTNSRELIRTPDLDGLPFLEKMILKDCKMLKEIHPSIGYHKRLIFLNMENCTSLKIFPPIIQMKKLETLIFKKCFRLHKFPEIQMNMDNLEELNLRGSGIEILPSSIGQYCTNLLSLDLGQCRYLKSIEGNFHRLQHLKRLHLEECYELKIRAGGLFDVECCLQVLSLRETSFRKFYRGMVSVKLLGFSSSLTRLNLSRCGLVDGDISSVFREELPNLQALNLSRNKFSRLYSSLLKLPRLKFLNLSDCHKLVELPDLPSSIAVLIVEHCELLETIGHFPTNLKWLWKLRLHKYTTTLDCERVAQSMLQGNVVEDYFLCLYCNVSNISARDFGWETCMLELPPNWKNEFSGFLIYVCDHSYIADLIVIEDAMGRENEDLLDVFVGGTTCVDDALKVSNDETTNDEDNVSELSDDNVWERHAMCYISFASMKHTTWWNSIHTKISLSIESRALKVELVPRISKGDSIERQKYTINSLEFWDEQAGGWKAFEIVHDSKSSIEIGWIHACGEDMFLSI